MRRRAYARQHQVEQDEGGRVRGVESVAQGLLAVRSDGAALAAFNAAWGLLHEIEHAVNDSADAERSGEAGECEEAINRMRRECGLAERAEYFYTPLPGGDFKTRYVRLAFKDEGRASNKRRRYWLYWNAALTGGEPEVIQVASR